MQVTVLTGSGRSGTNWLLDMLDVDPHTRCRNEPHAHGILAELPLAWQVEYGTREFYERHWRALARESAHRLGPRDHHVRYPKSYLSPAMRSTTRVLTGPRARRSLQPVVRRFGDEEFDIPRWIMNRDRLESAHLVLKMLIDHDLTTWLLEEQQGRVVHAIRHPGGRLNSWWRRFGSELSATEQQVQLRRRISRLELVAAHDDEWRELMPRPASMGLIQAEVWFWRYVNESTWLAGQHHSGYRLVRFDDVARSPIEEAEKLFHHVGATWDDRVAHAVREDLGRSVFGPVGDSSAVATAWQSQLLPEHREAMEAALAGSFLTDLVS